MENINKGLLHRAFSVFVFRPSDGKLLLQQCMSEKITFPDMWMNTCCSHPLDDFDEEKIERKQHGEVLLYIKWFSVLMGNAGVKMAASRKLEHELGIPKEQTPIDKFQYLTRIHYLAPSNGMWGEHESAFAYSPNHGYAIIIIVNCTVDYILFMTTDMTVNPNVNEIRDHKYVSKEELQAMFKDLGA